MQRLLLLDNYDSFTFNLAHYLTGLGVEVEVMKNDAINIDPLSFDGIVLSPGPGLPRDAGRMNEIIQLSVDKIPVLGVCLGMQAIGEFLGGELYNLHQVKHGVQETVQLLRSPLFEDLKEEMEVGLYHSWAVKEDSGDFQSIAKARNGVLMALSNEKRKLYGVQFHPESVMTPLGKTILKNFVRLA